MYATLATPCWAPTSTVPRICPSEATVIRRETLSEVLALLAEIAAPPGRSGHEPADLPAALDGALNAWLARQAV
jgi:hypothetical protein